MSEKEKIIITGTAGQGKSAIVHELRKRGQYAHDGDYYAEMDDNGKWNWDPKKINEILDDPNVERSYVAGFAHNIEDFTTKATKLIVLHTSKETMDHRLRTRKGNSYGKERKERREAIGHNEKYFARMMRLGGIAVSTELDIDVTVDQILDITGGHQPEPNWRR